jgi:hypothetical protein
MDEEIICNCLEKHPTHICMLRHKGLISTVRQLARFPNVACGNCGEETDSEDNVCMPVPLFL